jgi:hypothetical protein
MTVNVNEAPARDARSVMDRLETCSTAGLQATLLTVLKQAELREGEMQALEHAIDLMSAVRAFLKQRAADTKELSRSTRVLVEARAEADGIMRIGSTSIGGHESLPPHSWLTMRIADGSVVVERRGGARVEP